MGISKYNNEGYYDPTTYEALTNVIRAGKAAEKLTLSLWCIYVHRIQVMFMNYVLLGKCDELWVFGSTISNGMAYEIEIASKRKQKIRRFTEECEEA